MFYMIGAIQMKIDPDAYNRGLALLNELHGGHSGAALIEALKSICPDFATMTIQFAFGQVITREGLDLKTRELTIIASCVTLGHAIPQLKAHVEAALKVGATQQEIVEVIMQTALYAGFPAVSNAFLAIKDIFANN